MKRFLMFLVIAIAVVSLGLTIYYFSADNEVIYIKSSYLVVDQYDNIRTIDGNNDLVDFKNRSEHTTLSYSIEQTEDVLEYNEAEGFFTAKVGGESKIIIKTNNRNYSRLVVDVLVCDGSNQYPYIIKSEEDLKKVGRDDKYTSSTSVKLGNDIELTEPWTPIPSYSGTFDGNYFTINNMQITDAQPSQGANVEGIVGTNGAETYAGFIGVLQPTGVLKNLFLTNVDINTSAEYTGSFVGINKGLVQTSESTGVIKSNQPTGTSYVGGVVGSNINETNKAKIDRCGFEGSMIVIGEDQIAGGVAGQNQASTVSETYARLELSNRDAFFGGIVGENEGLSKGTADIYDSYFYMTAKNSQTNYANIGGVTYKNIEVSDDVRNMVTGNYNGGIYKESDAINKTTIYGSFKSVSNGYLTSTLNEVDQAEFIDTDSFVTTKAQANSDKKDRLWNFESVWEMSNKYPILNVFSSVGSTYIIELEDITVEGQIYNAQTLYNALSSETSKNWEVTQSFSVDANADGEAGFVWGDSQHPIPETFNGTIINPNGYVISDIEINNTSANENVGLVRTLGSSAVLKDLIFKNITITGADGKYVGAIAGESNGALVQGVEVENVTVNINGTAFGGLFGRANDLAGHGIKDVKAKIINSTNGYYLYAGGLVGINLTTITAETDNYNDIYNVYLVANQAGGVAGANGGKIFYTSALDINFVRGKDATTITNLYSGNPIFIGGIIGVSQYVENGIAYQGNVSDVYANIKVVTETGSQYKIYVGGVAGYNNGYIIRAYVKAADIKVTGSQSVLAGGVAGYNAGRISNSVVDKDSKIDTLIVASVGASGSNNNYILNTTNCSIVGGLVGYDAQTSNSTYSIYQCASYMSLIKGYYAGGLTGISFGKVEYSYCGNAKEVNGKVSIQGYMAGGLAGVVGGGFVKDCYTICSLTSAPYGGKYLSIISAIKMDVSCMGGLTTFVLNEGTLVQGCYAVASFNGNGVSFGSSADLTGYVCGTISKCAYQNAGSQLTSYGTQVSASNLKGADGYYAFRNAIGSIQNWNLENGYPVLEGVDHRFPGNSVPVSK